MNVALSASAARASAIMRSICCFWCYWCEDGHGPRGLHASLPSPRAVRGEGSEACKPRWPHPSRLPQPEASSRLGADESGRRNWSSTLGEYALEHAGLDKRAEQIGVEHSVFRFHVQNVERAL